MKDGALLRGVDRRPGEHGGARLFQARKPRKFNKERPRLPVVALLREVEEEVFVAKGERLEAGRVLGEGVAEGKKRSFSLC